MSTMSSVRSFRDFYAVGTMQGAPPPYQLMEFIEIGGKEQFERDNSEMPGKAIADKWAEWVQDWTVVYLEEIK